MPKLIKNGAIVEDAWLVLKLADGETPVTVVLPDGPLLVPLSVWQVRKDEILVRDQPIGVWLDAGEGPEALAADLAYFPVVAVNFPKFADGRGYSTARLLRERYAYTGELRAIGDVLRDQLYFMRRCGFDAYAVRADKDIEDALAGFKDFPENYQAAFEPAQPLFRRRVA